MSDTELTIRQMHESDLPFVDALRQRENWNQTPDDLARLLGYEPQGCFVACWDGVLVGSVTTTTYGRELGWIGMMLVHPEYRRRGIASALIQTSLDYLNDLNTRCVKLDATPAGKFVYERLGFQAEWEFHRWERDGKSPPIVSRSASQTFACPSMDAQAFGVDRSRWLNQTAKVSQVVQRDSSFGMLRAGSRAAYLGPLVAEHKDIAHKILQDLIGPCGSQIIWDVPGSNPEAVKLAEAFQFRPVRHLLRMWTGRELIAGDVSLQYALVDPATG